MSERKPKDKEWWWIKVSALSGTDIIVICQHVVDGGGKTWWQGAYGRINATPLAPVPDYALWQETVAALESITYLCEVHGDFKNGITDQSGSIDGGEGFEIVNLAAATLAKIKALGGE